MDGILATIKKLLGIPTSVTNFDGEILVHINSILMFLSQIINVADIPEPFVATEESTWSDYTGDVSYLEGLKTYIYLRVRLLFDPPTSSFLVTAIQDQIREFEFRLNISGDIPVLPEPIPEDEEII